MSNIVVAVSGGVDSMVLLDIVSRQSKYRQKAVIVAHFDHGIRDDSSYDAQFVEAAARRYGYQFVVKREELGASASEELARRQRYQFLETVAQECGARIVTAHHLDDLVETVAINFTRGTGWRGLAPFSRDIDRPLLSMTKDEIIAYAKREGIAWREDPTNATDAYLRNRIRRKVEVLDEDVKRQIHALVAHQKQLRHDIETEVDRMIAGAQLFSRYVFTSMPDAVAIECLEKALSGRLTRPQLRRLLHAIKVQKPGATYQAGSGVTARFTIRNFTLKLIELER